MNKDKISSIVKNSTLTLLSDATVEVALHLMKENAISSVIIVNAVQEPIGIFTERDSLKLIAGEAQHSSILGDVMTKNVFTISHSFYIHDAYVLMEQQGYRHIVIVDDANKFVGVVTEGDFLRHMGFEDMVYEKQISDAMSDSILEISEHNSIIEVAQKMNKKGCDYAIIMHHNKPHAIITERDISLYSTSNTVDASVKISMLPNNTMHTIEKNKSLEEATSFMQQHSVHQLIVINEKKELVGLITRHDILKAIHGAYFDFLLRTINEKAKKEEQLIKQAQELEKLANYDPLTQLPNRLLFEKMLQKSLANAIRYKYSLVVVFFDLDRFRDINDSYGHKIGDELLKVIALRFTSQVREGDFVARLSGNEFAIILEHVNNDAALPKIITKILDAISQPINLSNDAQVSIEACAGIVSAPDDAHEVEQITQYANSALHQAKKEGRGIYTFYTDEFLEKSLQRLAYENGLRNALKNNELELYYQAQVHIKTDTIIGAEALLRWKTKDKEMIPPALFIPIADETGLINSIGEWVLFEACRQGKIWMDKGHNITLAINVSANQVKYQDLPTLVSKALLKYNYDPHKLELEITESALMQRENEVVTMLYSLRALGIKLAIDDFGTGYSSLAYLKRFPIDVLKIDKSFVDDIPYETDDCAIVTTIIEMGKALGYQVLAEGIEKQEQLDFLSQKGCNLYQGYIKSKPLPAQEFEKFLASQKTKS